MKIKQIIGFVALITFTLTSMQSLAQEASTSNSPKDYYDALIVHQQNLAVEIIECNEIEPLLNNRKAKKMMLYVDNLIMQSTSIDRQLEMFPKSFSDPATLIETQKLQDKRFLEELNLKVQAKANENPNNNQLQTDYIAGEYYSVLFAIADDNIPTQKYPQQNDVFVKVIANNKVAHFVGKFDQKNQAENLKNSLLQNTTYKEAIVVLIK